MNLAELRAKLAAILVGESIELPMSEVGEAVRSPQPFVLLDQVALDAHCSEPELLGPAGDPVRFTKLPEAVARLQDDNRSSCCGAKLRPIYEGHATTRYRCGQCGSMQAYSSR